VSDVKSSTLSDQIRQAIEGSELSLYRIAKSSKVSAAALTRFRQGKSLTLTSVDRIAGVLGLEIVTRRTGHRAGAPR
jgi:transcriptional regulator with XRE-family HTH domain